MSSNNSPKQASEEIDLGSVFKLVGQARNSLFKGFLQFFVFLKRNFLWLTLLVVIGVGLAIALNKFYPPKYALDVIVTPNLENKNYLLATVSEIQANLRTKDTSFLNSLGVDQEKLGTFSLEVEPLNSPDKDLRNQDIKYLETLQSFESSTDISDIVRAELRGNTPLEYLLHFEFSKPEQGVSMARKTLDYINSNPYYSELFETLRENAENRIRFSDSLISQSDMLIENFNEKMLNKESNSSATLVLDGEQDLNITELLQMKRTMSLDIENQKLKLSTIKSGITVISFGKAYAKNPTLLERRIVLYPLLLIAGFLLFALLKYFNRKSQEYQMV